jgi:RNA polymerase sigma-70 factor (ECF subfamily)
MRRTWPDADPYPVAAAERLLGDVLGEGGQISKESIRLAEAVEAARRGDPHGWNVLFERFHADVHAYALARLGGWADAEDVTQETFVAAVGSIRSLRDGREPVVQAWLLRICGHKAVDRIRRKGRDQRSYDVAVPVAPDPALIAETRVLATEMREAMDELTEEQRDILIRRFVLDHSLEAVAAATDRSVGAVKSLQHRALAALRHVLAARAA